MAQPHENGCLPFTNSFVTVPQDKYVAVETFGKFSHMLSPGLSFAGLDCCGLCITFRSITSRVEQNLVQVLTKTRDNAFLNVNVAVQQSVKSESAQDAMYKVTDMHMQVSAYVSDVVRSHVPSMSLDDVFERKDDIASAVQAKLTMELAEGSFLTNGFGVQIHQVLITELQPDASVQASMNEINKQKRLRDASILAAEAEKVRVVTAAEAAADASQLQGEGIARQRRAIIDGLRESITHGVQEDLSPEKISELLLITQYFDTLRDIAATSKAQTVFLPHSAGAVSDVASQIRGGFLQAGAPEQMRM